MGMAFWLLAKRCCCILVFLGGILEHSDTMYYSVQVCIYFTNAKIFNTKMYSYQANNTDQLTHFLISGGVVPQSYVKTFVKTQRNSTQLKATLKKPALELDIVVTCSTHPTPLPQTFQPLLDQLES